MADHRQDATISDDADRRLPQVYSEDGVDLTLIHWMLSLTPAERLQVLQRTIQSILRLRGDRAEP